MKKRYFVAGIAVLTLIGAMMPDAPETAAEAQAKQKAKEARITELVNRKLTKRCETQLKSTLKDPSSYRRNSANVLHWDDEKNVTIVYTATNSFGGRVRDEHVCRYVPSA